MRILYFLLMATTCALPVCVGAGASDSMYVVKVPAARIPPGSSVVSFELHVVAGAVRSLSYVPVGWYITIDNDASWRTTIKGNSTVGAAGLSAAELQRIAIHLQKNEFGDLKLAVSGFISVTKDYKKIDQIPVQMGGR